MTSERDFDRLARAWLELGPDEAPDRVVAAILQAADMTPQVRRPIRRPTWRLFDMTRLPLVAGAAAILAVVIGGGILLTRGATTGGVGPSASPTAAPTAVPSASGSSAATGVPALLRYTWMGSPRDVPGLGPTTRAQITFTDTEASTTGTEYGFVPELTSSAQAADTLTLTLDAAALGCGAGDVGRYTWSLASGDTVLTLTPVADRCAARATAFAGTWFRRTCTNTENGCLGFLGAGTYPSQYIMPRREPGQTWGPVFGAITYTVPDGWANSADWPNTLTLTPSANYALETKDGPPDGGHHEIDVLAQPRGNRQAASDCAVRSVDPTAPTTVDGLLGWLAKQPSLKTTAPIAITVDGHPGKWIDVTMAPSWKQGCADEPTVPASTFLAYAIDGADAWAVTLIGQERIRLLLIDLDGQTIAILVDSSDPTTFDDLATQATPIIGSFRFQ